MTKSCLYCFGLSSNQCGAVFSLGMKSSNARFATVFGCQSRRPIVTSASSKKKSSSIVPASPFSTLVFGGFVAGSLAWRSLRAVRAGGGLVFIYWKVASVFPNICSFRWQQALRKGIEHMMRLARGRRLCKHSIHCNVAH